MNRSAFLLLILLSAVPMHSQDMDRVDATVQFYPNTFESVNELSDRIVRDFTTDEERVRAMYGWIIHNVRYDPDEYKVFNYKFKDFRDRNAKEETMRNKIIQRTVQKGVGVCEGYAMLFEKLCELQGIRNYLVRGDAKTNFKDIGREFQKIHMWNVVYIDDSPYLLDATWGAGRFNQQFIKEPNYFWFQTDPKLFVNTHYPDLAEDTLLENPISKADFAAMPLLINKQLYLDDVVTPNNGQLNVPSREIQFQLKMEAPKTISYVYNFKKDKIEVPFTSEAGFVQFSVKNDIGKLIVYVDDEPALAYTVE